MKTRSTFLTPEIPFGMNGFDDSYIDARTEDDEMG